IAERLHDTVSKGAKAPESPVVLLRNHAHWEAPKTFAIELGKALGRESHQGTLVATFGPAAESGVRGIGDNAFVEHVHATAPDDAFRVAVARRLTEWKRRFVIVVLNPAGPLALDLANQIAAFADVTGDLIGPGDEVPVDSGFVLQSSVQPSLPRLDGSHQLIWDACETDVPTARFRRTAGSIARSILKTQVGVALGGGAAWGWAHIGVLKVIEEAGIPIDVISGCSMGSVIGSFRSFGMTVPELMEMADYWKSRTGRFIEWRIWRMSLLNEGVVKKTFEKYFGGSQVNQTEIPYWANAVDIANGHEFTITDGSLVDAVRASIALPGLISPAKRGAHLLVDAGIMDPVPVNLIRRMGCRYAIAVNAMARLEDHAVSTRYPFNMFDIMLRCTRIMGHEIGAARAEDSANITLTPALGRITMLQFARAPEIIECGRAVAEENLPAILAGYEQVRARPPLSKTEVVHQGL
ncbi:MAG: patatin-like phospholipase family protein, partial [Phycisphaerales bacterium]|nr:patatin-like phospholipase family protein [Phycisphaerales bacterium]